MAGDGTWCCYPVPDAALGPAGSCSKSPLEPSFLAPPPPPVALILQNIRNIMTTSSRLDLRNFSFVQSEFLYPDPVYFLDRLSCFLRRISALCFAAAFHSYFFRPCAALCHICYICFVPWCASQHGLILPTFTNSLIFLQSPWTKDNEMYKLKHKFL